MPKLILEFEREEIQNAIPYAFICETRYGKTWDTMRRKREWTRWFSEKEREKCSKLFSQSHIWYLVKGVPDTVVMSQDTYDLWMKLAAFCASI